MKFFNTAGPVKREKHYLLDPLSRIDLDEVTTLIEQEKYFVLHAPRQTGKTSILLALMERLNREGQYHCLYVNVESAQAARENVDSAMRTILSMLGKHAKRFLGDDFLEKHRARVQEEEDPHAFLYAILSAWAEANPKPLVLLLDEIDSLVGDTLISVLRQLRTGYALRPDGFPQSVVLCGVRDVRDYRIYASSEKDMVTGGSAFNIKARSLPIGNFSRAETHALLQQHTAETGQIFPPEVLEFIWNNTLGQPWLVNALAHELIHEMKANRNPEVMLTLEMAVKARENIILRKETHLDQLADKLQEPRVQRVIAPILTGNAQSSDLREDDITYVRDLGLIVDQPQIDIANPIYREVVPRMLAWPVQVTLSPKAQWYVSQETGLLDMDALLEAFQQFFRENSEHWVERFQYKEAGAQLLLQAFLQRIINGGGRLEREYGLGKGRTDLFIVKPHKTGVQRIVLELKIMRGARQTEIDRALPQIFKYMDRCKADQGHLVFFDQRERQWKEKIFRSTGNFNGRSIQIWGM